MYTFPLNKNSITESGHAFIYQTDTIMYDLPPKTTSIPKRQIDPNPNNIQNSAEIIPTPQILGAAIS